VALSPVQVVGNAGLVNGVGNRRGWSVFDRNPLFAIQVAINGARSGFIRGRGALEMGGDSTGLAIEIVEMIAAALDVLNILGQLLEDCTPSEAAQEV
jgi:hypothetical protein